MFGRSAHDESESDVRDTRDVRDVKDIVTVCDFGIAQLSPIQLSGSSSPYVPTVTGEGMVVGTPAYMSPEQARADRSTRAATCIRQGSCCFRCLRGSCLLRRDAPGGRRDALFDPASDALAACAGSPRARERVFASALQSEGSALSSAAGHAARAAGRGRRHERPALRKARKRRP